MAKRIVQMHDKHKSTTNLYHKVTMGSLSPQVKAYIESQGGGFSSLEITTEQVMYSKNGVSLTYGSCTSFDNITDNVVEL